MSMLAANAEECFTHLGPKVSLDTAVYCNATWDTVLCWAAAYPNTTVVLPCPALHGLDTSKFAFRHCGPDGRWQSREAGDYSSAQGYTFYRGCYTDQARQIMEKYQRHLQEVKNITEDARTLEMVGLSVSLVSTLLSLIIFCYFRSLRCHRTRIHQNLFVAIALQIAMRIVVCVDQYISRHTGGEVAGASSGSSGALYDTPVFCEILYGLLEYTKTVKFMWMLVEGLYLHNMTTVAFFSGRPNYILFYLLGWGLPVLLLVAWLIPMTQLFKVKCWFAYYYFHLIWILEGPRAAVMAINLGFLLNIIRVLVMKLRESHNNEARRIRKAVKAAIVLLPLLGLTNFVIMLEPTGDDLALFAVWIFSAHFLTDFEGFFISLIYCFLNGEVQWAVRRQAKQWKQDRIMHSSSFRRVSRSLSAITSFTDMLNAPHSQPKNTAVTMDTNGALAIAGAALEPDPGSAQLNGHAQMPLMGLPMRRFSSVRRGARQEPCPTIKVSHPLETEHKEEDEI